MDRDDAGAGRDPAADDSNATAPQQAGGTSPATSSQPTDTADPVSRRRFLRAAVIGGAGVAGGAAAVGALVASGNLPGAIPVQQAYATQVSFHDSGCSMSVESSNFSIFVGSNPPCPSPHNPAGFDIHETGGGVCKAANPGDFYVFFTVPNLPAGTYGNATFTLPSGFSTQPATGGMPWSLNQYPAGTAPECPTSLPSTGSSATLAGLFPITTATTEDLQIQVHVSYSAAPTSPGVCFTGPFTFTASLDAVPAQASGPICSGSVTISATQTS